MRRPRQARRPMGRCGELSPAPRCGVGAGRARPRPATPSHPPRPPPGRAEGAAPNRARPRLSPQAMGPAPPTSLPTGRSGLTHHTLPCPAPRVLVPRDVLVGKSRPVHATRARMLAYLLSDFHEDGRAGLCRRVLGCAGRRVSWFAASCSTRDKAVACLRLGSD